MASSVKSLPAIVAAIAASTVSFFGCARLLWCVNVRLGPSERRRLFPRQLRSLAVAGLFASISAIPIVWVDFWHMRRAPAQGVCEIVFNIFRPARFVSALQETHLALTFLSQVVRAKRVLRCLNYGIPVLWTLGLLLGVADAVLFPFRLDEHDTCATQSSDVISICIIGPCVLTSCLASIATLVKASANFTTLAVQRRFFKRAVWYPCISVLSYAPIMTVYSHSALSQTQLFPIAAVCELCNGAMNAGMFCLQSHYAQRLGSEAEGIGEKDGNTDGARVADDIKFVASFDVGFASEADVLELLAESPKLTLHSSAESGEETHAGSEAFPSSLQA